MDALGGFVAGAIVMVVVIGWSVWKVYRRLAGMSLGASGSRRSER